MNKIVMPNRIASIDVFRALTMLLMIFVNELWVLTDIPKWLEHAPSGADFMGLADVVFPLFLFIVGMSIPFAIKSRQKQQQSNLTIIKHVLLRAVALMIMGMFMENRSRFNADLTGISSYIWILVSFTGFLLIWNDYPKSKPNQNKLFLILKSIGVLLVVVCALIFRGGTADNLLYMQPHWWGILGLIGWTYLLSTIIYLFTKHNNYLFGSILVILILFNILSHSPVKEYLVVINHSVGFLGTGAFCILTLTGVFASLIFIKAKENKNITPFVVKMLIISAVTFVLGVLVRPLGGISKLHGTPSWVFFSLAVAFFVFVVLFWIVDVKKYNHLFDIVKPAGTNTLWCYLIPVFYQTIVKVLDVSFPIVMNTGYVGLIKTALLALSVVIAAGLSERIGVKMKL